MKIATITCGILSLVLASLQGPALRKELDGAQAEQCTELFPRLFYTNSTGLSTGSEQFAQYIVRFNTQSQCNSSFVIYSQSSKVSKTYCQTEKMSVTQETTFLQFIHSCTITVSRNYPNFTYGCYGGHADNGYGPNHSPQYTISIPQKQEPLRFVVAGDWGPIRIKPYTAIYPSLAQIIRNKQKYGQVHGLMIVGDIAYDLHSHECQQFITFMQELSTVSCVWPILSIVGNHEASGLSSYIFLKNFNSPSLDNESRTQCTEFWNLKIIAFNPFLEIYNLSTIEKYTKMKSTIIDSVQQYKRNEPHSFIILTSHYPITCSQKVFHCTQTMLTMSDLFEELSALGAVDFYLAGHMHQYERIYPYVNKQFLNGSESPYEHGMMVSVVEGVAGCDLGIIETDFKTSFNSAKHSYNKTGFGLLKFDWLLDQSIRMTYQHVISQPMLDVFDRIVIQGNQPESEVAYQ